jgi:hypothetical protein
MRARTLEIRTTLKVKFIFLRLVNRVRGINKNNIILLYIKNAGRTQPFVLHRMREDVFEKLDIPRPQMQGGARPAVPPMQRDLPDRDSEVPTQGQERVHGELLHQLSEYDDYDELSQYDGHK